MLISVRLCPHLLIRRLLENAPPPHEAHASLAAEHDTTFVLESREGPERLARFSFVGFAPLGTVECTRDGLQITGELPAVSRDQNPIEYLRRLQAFYFTDDHSSPFVGGIVGSFGYHFGRITEPILDDGQPESWPRFLVGLYLDGLVYDHVAGTCEYVSRGEDRSELLNQSLAAKSVAQPLQIGKMAANLDHAEFCARVKAAQQLIARGECFQIVLSRQYTAPYSGSLAQLYGWLRQKAAVPYLYYLRFSGDRQLLGASPEMLVRVRNGRCETFPIAGTRPLTGDEQVDDAAGTSLLGDQKETAEHAMLVDLARNDLGRVCVPGSVEVESYQELQKFRTVQHLVSRVAGNLAADSDAFDALAAVFPAGTVSGAPKIRAQQHIDKLEGDDRGAYAGAVAYVSFNGDFDSAIAIRSMSASGGVITIQAGAGIVHRSDPVAEFEETRHKAGTMLQAAEAFGASLEAE